MEKILQRFSCISFLFKPLCFPKSILNPIKTGRKCLQTERLAQNYEKSKTQQLKFIRSKKKNTKLLDQVLLANFNIKPLSPTTVHKSRKMVN